MSTTTLVVLLAVVALVAAVEAYNWRHIRAAVNDPLMVVRGKQQRGVSRAADGDVEYDCGFGGDLGEVVTGEDLEVCTYWNGEETCCTRDIEIDFFEENDDITSGMEEMNAAGRELGCLSEYVGDHFIKGNCQGHGKCSCIPQNPDSGPYLCTLGKICDLFDDDEDEDEDNDLICQTRSGTTFSNCEVEDDDDDDSEGMNFCQYFDTVPSAAVKCGNSLEALLTQLFCGMLCDPQYTMMNSDNPSLPFAICKEPCKELMDECLEAFYDATGCKNVGCPFTPDEEDMEDSDWSEETADLCFDGEKFVNGASSLTTAPLLIVGALAFLALF